MEHGAAVLPGGAVLVPGAELKINNEGPIAYQPEVELRRRAKLVDGEVRIEVTFEINTDGILEVRARDLETGSEQRARIQVLGTVSRHRMAELVRRQADLPAPVDEAVPD
jgi:molecular chaperone DnaK (HSP70)